MAKLNKALAILVALQVASELSEDEGGVLAPVFKNLANRITSQIEMACEGDPSFEEEYVNIRSKLPEEFRRPPAVKTDGWRKGFDV